jgi:hypothetical protein
MAENSLNGCKALRKIAFLGITSAHVHRVFSFIFLSLWRSSLRSSSAPCEGPSPCLLPLAASFIPFRVLFIRAGMELLSLFTE